MMWKHVQRSFRSAVKVGTPQGWRYTVKSSPFLAVALACTTFATCSLTYSTTSADSSPNGSVGALDGVASNMSKFYAELASIFPADQIESHPEELKQRGKPWNSYHKINAYPDVIVYPKTTEDVSKVCRLCSKYSIPIVAFGGGTSLEGQTLTAKGGVSLDFNHMTDILELNELDLDVRVQAGLGYVRLNELLKDKGVWFPLDPGPGASIGGMCACRCSGSTAVRYGSMRDNVLNVTAVLPDGTVFTTGSRARKSSAGYDLTRLLVGSEGTLAIITEVTLKLHGIPKVSHAVRIAFPTVREAALTAKDTLNCGVTIGRCEMLDEAMVKIVNQTNPTNPLGPWLERTTLLYEITGISEAAVAEQIDIVTRIAKQNGGSAIYVATNEEETKQFWKFRKECLWSAMSQHPDREPMITDVCVPLSKLADLIDETKRAIDQTTLPCPIIAHAGDGNFHVLIMFKPDDPQEVAQAKHLAHSMGVKAIQLGGTCTGEHGIGSGKKELLRMEMGEGSMGLMTKIKTTIDPLNIMNPGKILDVEGGDKEKHCCSAHRKAEGFCA